MSQILFGIDGTIHLLVTQLCVVGPDGELTAADLAVQIVLTADHLKFLIRKLLFQNDRIIDLQLLDGLPGGCDQIIVGIKYKHRIPQGTVGVFDRRLQAAVKGEIFQQRLPKHADAALHIEIML